MHKDLWALSRLNEAVSGGGFLGLRRLLDISCSSDCRDKRDKVFLLLGMIDPEIARALAYDYSMKTSQIFESVTRLFITRFNNLEPSPRHCCWGTSSGANRPASIMHKPCCISLPPLTLCAHSFVQRGWAWLASQEVYYFRRELWREADDGLELGDGLPLRTYFDDAIPMTRPDPTTTMFTAPMTARAGKERRLRLTQRGFVGWTPDNMYSDGQNQTRVGVVICVLFGCSVPLVVRPRGDRWQVVGEAYVQEAMDGEALVLLESGECAAQMFTFC